MIKLILRATLLAAMLMAATVIANADSVTYSTTGCFGLGCIPAGIGDSTAVGAGALQYVGQLSNTINVPNPGFTSAQLGRFGWTGDPNGLLGPIAFTLQITQTVPAGTGTFSALVSGFVTSGLSGASSTVNVVFSTTQVTINGVTYTLSNLGGPGTISPNALLINPPGQLTSVQSIVTVPEPASMLLLGTGLLGAAGAVRRRLKRD